MDVCYLFVCACCFTLQFHFCNCEDDCCASVNYTKKFCFNCIATCTLGYCVEPCPVKINLVKTFWQLYKKPCSQLATHNKLNWLLQDFDNSNLYMFYKQQGYL